MSMGTGAGNAQFETQQPEFGIGGATPMPTVGGFGGIDPRAVAESASAFSKGGRIRNPELPGFRNPNSFEYGYSAPIQVQMPMSMQMPVMNLQTPEGGIVDPTYLAQLAILNQAMGMPMGQPIGLLGSGLGPQERGPVAPFLTIPDYRPMAQNFGGQSGGGFINQSFDGGGGGDSFGGFGDSGFGGGGDGGFGGDSGGHGSSGPGGSSGESGAAAGGAGPGGPGGHGDSGDGGGGGGGGGGKIICTAMNQAYGFGSFRNAIWIAYSDKHLSKAHEVGYHALFLPLVDFGFKRGNGKVNVAVRKALEWGTRHRSTDLRAQMRGTKRDTTGRIIRMIFEPLCYAVGKLKGY